MSAPYHLRDFFAGQALQGYVASTAEDFEPAEFATKIAEDAFALADAMLIVRGSNGDRANLEKLYQAASAYASSMNSMASTAYAASTGHGLSSIYSSMMDVHRAFMKVLAEVHEKTGVA